MLFYWRSARWKEPAARTRRLASWRRRRLMPIVFLTGATRLLRGRVIETFEFPVDEQVISGFNVAAYPSLLNFGGAEMPQMDPAYTLIVI